jgi:hypothetical protein
MSVLQVGSFEPISRSFSRDENEDSTGKKGISLW